MIDISELLDSSICEDCNVLFLKTDIESPVRQHYCKRCQKERGA